MEGPDALIYALESRQHLTATDLLAALNVYRDNPTGARAQFGLTLPDGMVDGPRPQLQLSATFSADAQDWANWNRDRQTLTHVGEDGSVPLDRARRYSTTIVYCIENGGLSGPAWDVDSKLNAIQQQFVIHDGHFFQLEDPATRLVGIGWATGFYQNIFCVWLVEEYGTEKPSIPDVNLDGTVSTADFTAMAQHFGTVNATWSMGDVTNDGLINALDFNALATAYGIIQ